MVAILDFTREPALSTPDTAFQATWHIIGTKIVKTTTIEAKIWQSVQFYIMLAAIWDYSDQIAN